MRHQRAWHGSNFQCLDGGGIPFFYPLPSLCLRLSFEGTIPLERCSTKGAAINYSKARSHYIIALQKGQPSTKDFVQLEFSGSLFLPLTLPLSSTFIRRHDPTTANESVNQTCPGPALRFLGKSSKLPTENTPSLRSLCCVEFEIPSSLCHPPSISLVRALPMNENAQAYENHRYLIIISVDEERVAATQSVVVPSVVGEDIYYIDAVSRLYNLLYYSLI
jgi:hypothetical protein